MQIDMFKNYNNLVRPSPCNNSTIVHVEFGAAIILLIAVDEKNQILQTNLWVRKHDDRFRRFESSIRIFIYLQITLRWTDCQFAWSPLDYGGISSIRVPSDRVWLPGECLRARRLVSSNQRDAHLRVVFAIIGFASARASFALSSKRGVFPTDVVLFNNADGNYEVSYRSNVQVDHKR